MTCLRFPCPDCHTWVEVDIMAGRLTLWPSVKVDCPECGCPSEWKITRAMFWQINCAQEVGGFVADLEDVKYLPDLVRI